MPLIPALMAFLAKPGGAALASLAGGVAQGVANWATSAKQMKFQKEMSSTSFQRGMADMQAAGLNPILAYQKGGASTPSGSGIPQKNPFEGVPAAVSSAIQLKRIDAEISNINASTQNINVNSALALEKTQTQTNLTELQRMNIEKATADLGILGNNWTVSQQAAARATIERKIDASGYGKAILWLRRLKDLPGSSLLNTLVGRSGAGAIAKSLRRNRGSNFSVIE